MPGDPTKPIIRSRPASDPGTYAELHGEVMETLLDSRPGRGMFDGLKFNFSRMVSNHMQAQHVFNIGASDEHTPDAYTFQPVYIGAQNIGTAAQGPLVQSSLNTTTGTLAATIVHSVTNNLRLQFNGHCREKAEWVVAETSATYTGEGFTAGATCVNPDPRNGSGVVILNFLQKVTTHWTAGMEYLYQATPAAIGAALGGFLRYRDETCTATGAVNMAKASLHMSYHHKVSEAAHVATEFEANMAEEEIRGGFGYHRAFRGGAMKAMFNSKGEVAVSIDKELMGPTLSLNVQLVLDHVNAKHRAGIAMNFMT